ncbi:MAG: hypothetical protein V4721_00230 [Bacteroidota bacterium]
MKLSFAIVLLFISNLGFSQTYTQYQVINTARSYLDVVVGVELSKNFTLDKDSYYEYKTKTGKTQWGSLMKGKQTKGNFV